MSLSLLLQSSLLLFFFRNTTTTNRNERTTTQQQQQQTNKNNNQKKMLESTIENFTRLRYLIPLSIANAISAVKKPIPKLTTHLVISWFL